jgi:hypothetical protein
LSQLDPTLPRRARILLFIGLSVLSSLSCARSANAQGDPTLYKTQSISVFGGYIRDHVDYGPGYANGVGFGFDLNQHFRSPLTVSLEGRVNLAAGYYVIERSYLAGPRVEYRLGRIRPYGDVELGIGNIHFNPPINAGYSGDRSALIVFGGGIDFDLTHGFRAKADFQAQHWNISPTLHQVFTPDIATLGLTYVLPFRPFRKYGDPHY